MLPGSLAMVWRSLCALMPFDLWLLMGVRNTRLGRGIPISLYDSGVWWCCSATDVLTRLPAQIKREKKRKKGKEGNKKRFGRTIARTLIIKYDVSLFVVVALLQPLDDGATLLHSVGCVDFAAYTHDTHQATTAHA